MIEPANSFLTEVGIRCRWRAVFDRAFVLALAAGPFALLMLGIAAPDWNEGVRLQTGLILSMVVWRPLIEEMLFRGVMQGQFAKREWGVRRICGISGANALASVLFAAAHLFHHPPIWAFAVILPSLVFGYFRDRHGHILAPVLLHAVYNATYLSLGAAPNP